MHVFTFYVCEYNSYLWAALAGAQIEDPNKQSILTNLSCRINQLPQIQIQSKEMRRKCRPWKSFIFPDICLYGTLLILYWWIRPPSKVCESIFGTHDGPRTEPWGTTAFNSFQHEGKLPVMAPQDRSVMQLWSRSYCFKGELLIKECKLHTYAPCVPDAVFWKRFMFLQNRKQFFSIG